MSDVNKEVKKESGSLAPIQEKTESWDGGPI